MRTIAHMTLGLFLLGAAPAFADHGEEDPRLDGGSPRDAGLNGGLLDAGQTPSSSRLSSIYAMGCGGTSASVVVLFGVVALAAPRRRRQR